MNEKNSLGLNNCFLDLDDPIELFKVWMDEAKKSEPNDPNALSLATSNKNNIPSVRMVLLKEFNQNGFVFYTNLNSQKGNELKENPNAAMCFHWKSLLRQIRISGTITQVEDSVADQYYNNHLLFCYLLVLKFQQFLFVLINFSSESTLWHLDFL